MAPRFGGRRWASPVVQSRLRCERAAGFSSGLPGLYALQPLVGAFRRLRMLLRFVERGDRRVFALGVVVRDAEQEVRIARARELALLQRLRQRIARLRPLSALCFQTSELEVRLA